MHEIALAVRVLLALVFLNAAFGKARHRLAFQGVVANYRLLPERAVPAFAWLLPLVEAAVAAALLFAPPFWPEAGGALLLLLFAAAMGINIRRGRRHIDCGCFQSALKQTLSWVLVGRNVALAALLAVPALYAVPGMLAVPVAVSHGGAPEPGSVEAVLMGGVLFVLLQTMNILWSVVPAWRPRGALATGEGK